MPSLTIMIAPEVPADTIDTDAVAMAIADALGTDEENVTVTMEGMEGATEDIEAGAEMEEEPMEATELEAEIPPEKQSRISKADERLRRAIAG